MKNQYIIRYTDGKESIINTDELGLISDLFNERVIITSTVRVIENVYQVRWLDKPVTSIEEKILELINTDDLAKSIENFKLAEKLFNLLDIKDSCQLMIKLQSNLIKELYELSAELILKTKKEDTK